MTNQMKIICMGCGVGGRGKGAGAIKLLDSILLLIGACYIAKALWHRAAKV